MEHVRFFTCDLNGERFEKMEAVRNDVMIQNGDNSRTYIHVCDKCIEKLVRTIDEVFPKNEKKTSSE